jgi:signal transduction histidine kinase
MPTSKFVVTSIPADRAQIRITSGVAVALFLVFVVALFERGQLVYSGLSYVPITSAVLIIIDWITAAMLLAQARALRASRLAVLGAGFFFTGLLVVLRALTVPATPDPTNQTALLFYLASHAALPLAVIPYAWLDRATNHRALAATLGHSAKRNLAGGVILVGILILAATATQTTLPFTSPVFLAGVVVLLLTNAAMTVLVLNSRSELDLWLLLALWGWLLEVALITLESPSSTAAWYAARGLGLASGLFVLFTLIAETSRLYGKSVQELEDQDNERERRYLVREAIGASLAHELRQPLAAILINAEVARKCCESDSGHLRAALDDIISSGHRARDVIQSTRAVLGGQVGEKRPIDLEALVRSSLNLVAPKARARKITTSIVMEGELKPVSGDPAQIQQALVNLFQNAICALTYVEGRDRILQVHCIARPKEDDVIIRVEDNGSGIEPENLKKVFTPFFTTRKHGTGLGLMIANMVVEAHGGKISVEPLSPFGTAFAIRLPYGGAGVSLTT